MNRFKERREQLKLTAEEASVRIGITVGTLYSWERGETKPHAESLIKMARAYDTTADWLLGLSE